MWLLLAWCIRLAGSQVCRPPDLGPQSEAFVNIEDVLVNQLDADGTLAELGNGLNGVQGLCCRQENNSEPLAQNHMTGLVFRTKASYSELLFRTKGW